MIDTLPLVNACLNGLAAVLLIAGYVAIKRKKIPAHKAFMIAAFGVSALFLACYLTYHIGRHRIHGSSSQPFPGTGIWRPIYFSILIPHILLAIGMLPMIFLTFLRAFRGDFTRHRRIARWTLPIWIYVSVTGVLVYLMLYRMDWS